MKFLYHGLIDNHDHALSIVADREFVKEHYEKGLEGNNSLFDLGCDMAQSSIARTVQLTSDAAYQAGAFLRNGGNQGTVQLIDQWVNNYKSSSHIDYVFGKNLIRRKSDHSIIAIKHDAVIKYELGSIPAHSFPDHAEPYFPNHFSKIALEYADYRKLIAFGSTMVKRKRFDDFYAWHGSCSFPKRSFEELLREVFSHKWEAVLLNKNIQQKWGSNRPFILCNMEDAILRKLKTNDDLRIIDLRKNV